MDKPLGRRQIRVGLTYAVIIVWINVYICRELFFTQTAPMNSMHGFWAALAKHGGASWLHSNWWPFWDGGMPWEFTYAPLIPWLISAWSTLCGITPDLAFQWITGVVYCLAPLTLFLMAWFMTRAPGSSFLAALFYSLSSPAQLIISDGEFPFRAWHARRLFVAAVWDDTPHLAALALLPVAIVFLALAIRKTRLIYYTGAVLMVALMVLASDFGAVELTTACLCLISVFPRRNRGRNTILILSICLFSYAIIAPFLSPSMLLAIFRVPARESNGWNLKSGIEIAVVALGWIILVQFLGRSTADWKFRCFILLAYLNSCLVIMPAYFHGQLLPQPVRYKLDMELAIAALLAFWISYAVRRMPNAVKTASLLLFIALAAKQMVSYRHFAKDNLQHGDLSRTIEYQTAKWASENLSSTRVMLPGSIAQWANDFSDVSQFSGSSWSQAYNQVQQRGLMAIYNGGQSPEEDARVSLDWLKAFGVGAVAVSGPNSEEYWKPYAHPAKFEGLLPVLWRERDVTVYRVPQRSASLAHVVNESAIVSRPPTGPRDVSGIEKYVAAIDDVSLPAAELHWAGSNKIDIETTAASGQAISLQVSYHPGWHAKVGTRAVDVHRDGLGLMWLNPQCSGPCEIQLDYDGGWELRLCRYLSFTALAVLMAAILWTVVPRPRNYTIKLSDRV
jgi:hypothetical protein